jgi:hypothetical protein
MRRRHLKLLSLWIVPLLVLRALIPSGFMLSAGEGGLELTFCPAIQVADAHALHAGHHDAAHHHSGHSGAGDDDNAPCPFGLTASATTCDVPHLQAAADAPADEPFVSLSAPTSSVGPLRADRIRGPPVFA